ncbi:MAG: DegT/DnrJ/EryC1/StrS family aminotransferase [Desulfobulbaceae bacterium]|nr:DegT/DnrJ/EryC1/StrS family aminotransferase [Desulfobulbaceae bacterium]
MQVPLLDLKAQLMPLREEILREVTDVIDSTCYIMGPKVEELEKNITDYCHTPYALGVSSGTDALLVALTAMGVGPGDLVLTTSYTFFATVGSILRLGARPLFVDIDPVTFNIDPDLMAATLAADPAQTAKVKVILPVHLYGQCADMTKILSLADKYGIPVLEDAAQAIGADYPMMENGKTQWRKAGSMGIAGCYSFFPSKNLGGIGDGGMIVAGDQELYEKMRIIRVHGGAAHYEHHVVGGNFRLDPLQATVLNVKLPHLPAWHRGRRANAAIYNRLFNEAGLVASGKVRLPQAVYKDAAANSSEEPEYHIYNQYVIRVEDRDGVIRFLHEEGVGAAIYYPIPLHRQQCMAGLGYEDVVLPETDKAAAETLALPIYPELTEEMLAHVVERITSYFNR